MVKRKIPSEPDPLLERPEKGKGYSDEVRKQAKKLETPSVIGYFGKPKKGRKPKNDNQSVDESTNSDAGTRKRKDPPPGQTGMTSQTKMIFEPGKQKQKRTVTDWTKHADDLQAHVDARRNKKPLGDLIIGQDVSMNISRQTVDDYIKRLDTHKKVTGDTITVNELLAVMTTKNKGKQSIISSDQHDRLEKVMVARDARNDGMVRKEVIGIIRQLSGCTKNQATDYFKNAVRRGKFKYLKRGGRVCSAQATTTSRTQVTIEQQLRWHTAVEFCWEEQKERNQPADEFKEKHAYFQLNLDEESVMANDGNIKVIASIFGNKVEKNKDDNRGSVSIIRTGSAGGIDGPIFFLCAAKDKKTLPQNLRGDLGKHGLPKGSKVICTENAYLNDDAWLEVVPEICKGIREMEGIKGHDEWWVCLSCDGFGSHLIPVAYPIFTKYKIMLLLEDGDTSQTNQAFDQMKAKEDKRNIRSLLDLQRSVSNRINDQWTLIYVCIQALKDSSKQAWIDSFKRVNLHPDFRLDFQKWIKKIETQIIAGETFFKNRTSLYDILPKVWKDMLPEDRRSVVSLIDSFYASADETWSRDNVLELLAYVKLDDVPKLRACYWTAKRDESVIDRTAEEVSNENDLNVNDDYGEDTLRGILNSYHWYPKSMEREVGQPRQWNKNTSISETERQKRLESGLKWFKHITNNVATNHWANTEKQLLPSAHLNANISEDQASFLNPSMRDVILSRLEVDAVGEGAKKKRSLRRMDYVDGNAKSYSRWLNSPERMKLYKDYNALITLIAGMKSEKDEEKKKRLEEKKALVAERERKTRERELNKIEKKKQLMPELEEEVSQGYEHVVDLNNDKLRNILYYYFDVKNAKSKKVKKKELRALVKECMDSLMMPVSYDDDDYDDDEVDDDDEIEATPTPTPI